MLYVRIPSRSERLASEVCATIEAFNMEYRALKTLAEIEYTDEDIALVVGTDSDVLKAFHELGSRRVPVLGVCETETRGFLTEASVKDLPQVLENLQKKRYVVEESARLSVSIDDKNVLLAVNEAAIFPSKSATIMEYTLTVDDEIIWRDYSDGVIISTPLGSSAYALSAGGPMVAHRARVFVIVPVNSLDVTRRPLVIPDDSKILVNGVRSRTRCEVVIDGTIRLKVDDKVRIEKHEVPARLVKLPGSSYVLEKIAKKVQLAEELLKIPPSAKLILKTLEYEGPLTHRELVRKTMLPDRTMRQALALLIGKGMVKRKPLLRDARQKLYYIA
ncbi:MAG: NAD(+)/NADH kinase [Nitrososphaerota archaeon]|nr:NAD(+)/NADH kinase [Aigarchaeota archaeon]MDW8076405.1 NAD(+)/NADH kinase [Nitrososphaerota archaeon]